MGRSHGELFAKHIVETIEQLKVITGPSRYSIVRSELAHTIWLPAHIDDEILGMVEGIRAVLPASKVDVLDIKVLNTYGDWSYAFACRSHGSWGSRVASPYSFLGTRRLDFGVPSQLAQIRHHVLMARRSQEGPRWVNLAWAGYVNAVTAVNEYGTLGSLHDYQSTVRVGAYMPRTVAVRYALTNISGDDPASHLAQAKTLLFGTPILTGSFINTYGPGGAAGVFTCAAGAPCYKLRRPQASYLDGEVIITTNSETDGMSVPSGGEFMEAFYKSGSRAKTLLDHYQVMGHSGMHLLTVGYRGHGDMKLRFEGQLSTGTSPPREVEFSDLFLNTGPIQPPLDGGQGVPDGGDTTVDSGTSADMHGASDIAQNADGGTPTADWRATADNRNGVDAGLVDVGLVDVGEVDAGLVDVGLVHTSDAGTSLPLDAQTPRESGTPSGDTSEGSKSLTGSSGCALAPSDGALGPMALVLVGLLLWGWRRRRP
ncbi:MAG: hypothetical protein JRH20_22475 [Deltaproteobacteria bacterium]|nr:hypothetical protein [Deltaproteobacteria bacterium]